MCASDLLKMCSQGKSVKEPGRQPRAGRKPSQGVISGESGRGPWRAGYSPEVSQPETRLSCSHSQPRVNGCQDRVDIPSLIRSPRVWGRAVSRSPRATLQKSNRCWELEARPDQCQGGHGNQVQGVGEADVAPKGSLWWLNEG